MKILCLVLSLIGLSSRGGTWYVRPLVYSGWSANKPVPVAGVYGSQNGTSYANAWNGMQSIVWGVSGVNTGDTLYICGTNVANYDAGQVPNTISYAVNLTQSGVTLRGDYPGDTGWIFGGCLDHNHTFTWVGPDANGVYSSAVVGNGSSTYFTKYEIVNGFPQIYMLESGTTWTGGLGARYSVASGSNYVKTVSGGSPASNTNIAIASLGWDLTITNGTSNIVFQALNFYGGGLAITDPGANFYGTTNISFTNCTMLWGCETGPWFRVKPGHDYWNVVGCEIGYCQSCIYPILNSQSRGALGWNVLNCNLHDCDVPNFPDSNDAHIIGCQGCSSWTITDNTLQRGGAAIDFFIGTTQWQTNNLIARNFIKDIYVKNTTFGSGIEFEGTVGQVTGAASNNIIERNIIVNTGLGGATQAYQGGGVDWEQPDYVIVRNNTIVNARQGLQNRNNSGAVKGEWRNNVIYNPVVNFEYVVGSGTASNIDVNYNLFFTNAPLAVPFNISQSGYSSDANSVFSNPLFFNSSAPIASSVQVIPGSPALNAATNVNAGIDFDGSAVANNTTIGAWNQSRLASTLNVLNAANMRMSK